MFLIFFLFSDNSNKWDQIDEEKKKRLQFEKEDDGEFWMSFDDFILNFDSLTLIHINLNAFTEQQEVSSKSTRWNFRQHSGEWEVIKNPIKDHKEIFLSYPQHVINSNDGNDLKQMIISLMSTDYIERRKRNEEYASVTFHLFKVRGNNSTIKAKYEYEDLELIGKSNDIGNRDRTKRFTVQKG